MEQTAIYLHLSKRHLSATPSPLDSLRVKNVSEEYAKHSTALPEVPDPNSSFVFPDYLQWCWAYAIHLGDSPLEPNPIIHVGTVHPKVVARSFNEFMELYLRDARELYPDAR